MKWFKETDRGKHGMEEDYNEFVQFYLQLLMNFFILNAIYMCRIRLEFLMNFISKYILTVA